jgi:hypothetical protein
MPTLLGEALNPVAADIVRFGLGAVFQCQKIRLNGQVVIDHPGRSLRRINEPSSQQDTETIWIIYSSVSRSAESPSKQTHGALASGPS